MFSGSTEVILEYYFIEWCISVPLLLHSIQILKQISEEIFSGILICSILMNLSGYVSLMLFRYSYSNMFVYTAITISSGFYIIIGLILNYIYRYNESTIETQPQYNSLNKSRLLGVLMIITYLSWLGYPIVYILYLNNILTSEFLIISFSLLDIVSKGLFSFLPIGYEMHKIKANTLASRVTRRIARIEPTIPSNIPEPGEAEYTLTEVPNITQSQLYQLSQPSPQIRNVSTNETLRESVV